MKTVYGTMNIIEEGRDYSVSNNTKNCNSLLLGDRFKAKVFFTQHIITLM